MPIDMGTYIPVFFLPIERARLPAALPDWHSVEPLLGELWNTRDSSGLRYSLSRNFWHQDALNRICRGLGIEGLEFVDSGIACLCDKELIAAARGLDQVAEKIRGGLPYLGATEEENVDIQALRGDWRQDGYREFSPEELRDAWSQARALHEVHVSVDFGLQSVVGFYSFCRSLRATIDESLSQNKCMLYVRPWR